MTSLNDGGLSHEAARGAAQTRYAYPDPGWVSGVVGFGPAGPAGGFDPARRVLTFTTAALEQDLELIGFPRLVLYASSTATDTDFFPKAGMVETKAFQKGPVMAPQEVAELGYKSLMRGDRTVVAGGANKAMVFARRFMTEGAQAKMNKKFYEPAKPNEQKRQRGDIERKAEEKELAE